MKAFLFLFLIPLLLVSCEEKQLQEKLAGCYFQREYVNYAWGFSHSGFTITPSGEIYTFVKTTPWEFAKDGNISSESLQKNISASLKTNTLISKSDIERFQQLAYAAISGKMSERVSVGADMGGISTKIIVPDAVDPQNGYREFNLTIEGDFSQHNLAPEAAVIADWLNKLRIQ